MKRFKNFTLWAVIVYVFVLGISFYVDNSNAAGPVKIVDATGTATTNVASVTANKLATYDAGLLNQIRAGNISGHVFIRIEANNNTLGTAFGEVSELGTAGFGNWPAAAGLVTVASDSALDTTGGTGALTLTLRGLDSTFTAISEVVVMQGTSNVSTLDSFYRLHEMEVSTAGSGLTNAGTITATIGGSNIIALQDGHSKTSEGRYTVPAGYNLYLEDAEGSVIGTNKNATFHLFTRDTQTANAPFVLQQIWQAHEGGHVPDGKVAVIPEKHDVIILGQGSATGNDAAASMQGWIELE